MNSGNPSEQAVDPKKVDQKNFSAKFSTKAEVFRFLNLEADVYLPHYQTVTIWHLRDLAAGIKKVSIQHLT